MSQMGLATLKLDRFTCLETVDRETPGYVVTRAFTAAERGARLSLNISNVQPLRSWVEVEALPPEGDEPLPGFSRADGRPLHRDGLREHVAWRDRQLADVGQDAVRLRIHFCGEARVHALNFHR